MNFILQLERVDLCSAFLQQSGTAKVNTLLIIILIIFSRDKPVKPQALTKAFTLNALLLALLGCNSDSNNEDVTPVEPPTLSEQLVTQI